MSFVVVSPEVLAVAGRDLASIGSAISQANVAAAVPTMGALAAGADEVSAAVAAVFSGHAQAYQALGAQVAAFHDQLVTALDAAAGK
ncbi:PE family protein [Mycobacterium ulcerans]